MRSPAPLKIDITKDPIGYGKKGKPVYLKDIWPTTKEVADTVSKAVKLSDFKKRYADVFKGDANWRKVKTSKGLTYKWPKTSTYVANPPYFQGMAKEPGTISDIRGARPLAVLGDSITTDHISPAGSIKKDGPAGAYLMAHGVKPEDFNSYGARRGHHEVMMRGTFANIRLKNEMAPGTEGGVTRYMPTGEPMAIYDAAMKYQKAGTPLVVVGGKEYGTGSSRDWAAKGTHLLGIKAGAGRKLRAHPPLQPRRHGQSPAAVCRWPDAREFGADGLSKHFRSPAFRRVFRRAAAPGACESYGYG